MAKVKKALDEVRKALREDEEYYLGWKDNISICFQDAFYENEKRYIKKDIRQLANDSAETFLKRLIGGITNEQ